VSDMIDLINYKNILIYKNKKVLLFIFIIIIFI